MCLGRSANGTSFPDTVALGAYPIDVHSPVDDSLQLQSLKPDGFYEIPLRSLMPQNVENLLVAGRCISSTHTALAALRVAPTAMATGEAAGRTAALIINEQQSEIRSLGKFTGHMCGEGWPQRIWVHPDAL